MDIVRHGSYAGPDGEVRHVVFKIKAGRGYSVVWDSVHPTHANYYKGMHERRQSRSKGNMPLKNFEKWAVKAL